MNGDKADALYDLRGVGYSVSGQVILHPLDLTLPQGRMLALVGPNGSGKSTLLKILARQLVPGSGTLDLLGSSSVGYGDRDFARLVAYMPQFTPPAESLTVRELVALGRYPWHGALGRFGPADRAKVDEAIGQTGLGPLSERMVDSLSGGERQRAWLAMMLAQDTRCLLLDEPTSALDIAHQVEMLALVRRLSAERGIGVVIVLHDINMAARYCDDIVALREGRMIAKGGADALLDPDTLERIYGVRMGTFMLPATQTPISYVL